MSISQANNHVRIVEFFIVLPKLCSFEMGSLYLVKLCFVCKVILKRWSLAYSLEKLNCCQVLYFWDFKACILASLIFVKVGSRNFVPLVFYDHLEYDILVLAALVKKLWAPMVIISQVCSILFVERLHVYMSHCLNSVY